MYLDHFGLRHQPFRGAPDAACCYPAHGHERALAQLLAGLADDEGLLLLTGGPGVGKTLLCQCLLERLGGEVTSAFLTNSHLADRSALLQGVLHDLAQPHRGLSEQELRLALTDFLVANFAAGRRAVLVIDEAQHLPADLLEELRLLGNLEARQGKAVQVVLSAQPALAEALRRAEFACLNQRLTARARLDPLPVEEAADYLLHRLRAAGGRPERLMSAEALEVLAGGARGIPRLLNQAAHQALLFAYQAGAEQVDAEAALEALAAVGLGEEAGAAPARVEVDGEDLRPPEEGECGFVHRLVTPPPQPA